MPIGGDEAGGLRDGSPQRGPGTTPAGGLENKDPRSRKIFTSGPKIPCFVTQSV